VAPAPDVHVSPSRRRFLSHAVALGGLAATPPGPWLTRQWAQAPCDGAAAGELVRVLPLYGPGAQDVPLNRMVGASGLDARQFTDLSGLSAASLVTPADQVFVRTSAPPGLDHAAAGWAIALRPAAGTDGSIVSAAALAAEAAPMGVHLIECAGNSNPQNFGLMSAVAWDGVPLTRLLARVPRPPGATGVLIAGVDHDAQGSRQSLPGASWVLPIAALEQRQPFLAVRMNGQPLTPDHGAPVRLVVPGWYGCAWIKWVNELRWVGADEPSTSQMLEFAFRTHQDDIPELARDYRDPDVDTAAMPIRVEQRRAGGRVEYHVVGVVWGGRDPVERLIIRFAARDPGTTFAVCPRPSSAHTWALWRYPWRPAEPGYYDITLRAADPQVRTRRLDLSFYIRRVRIDEI
jgi:DMSO/TMAO reductase YedYZ molybdopterin-dependent catalytic subunit